MFLIVAWTLIGSSIFMGAFYLSVHTSRESEKVPELEGSPGVSVLMPAYNEEGLIGDAIKSVLDLEYEDLEVIVVDDGSDDNTFKEANSFESDRLTVLEHSDNRGKAAALNTALEETVTEYSAVIDADSCITEDVLEKSLAKIESDDSLGAVIGSIMPLSENSFMRRLQVVEYRMTNFYRSLMAHIDTLDVTPGAFSLYRTSDLKDVGGFDVGNPTEDLEMAWKLRKAGKSLDMAYGHYSNTELPKNFRELYSQRVRWARGFMYNALKHRDIFFNKELGWFGRFQMPMHTIMPVVALLGLGMVGIGLSQNIYNLLVSWSAVGFSLPSLQGFHLTRFLLSQQWTIYIPLAFSLTLTAYLIRIAYSKSGEGVRNYPGLLFYFVAFFAVKGFFWTAAVLKEMLQTKRVWD